MIKKIHYIWLGGKPKSMLIKRCIKSWRKHMPDWEIIEWNESNLNIDINKYCREAYDAKKYAFASDVLRFDILYREGGLYFDIDVKMLKSFEPLTQSEEAFTGFENGCFLAPGLVLYAKEPFNIHYKNMLDLYSKTSFILPDGSYNLKVVGSHFYDCIKEHGFVLDNTLQRYSGLTVFPSDYFCPSNYSRTIKNYTANTYSDHLGNASWMSPKERMRRFISKVAHYFLGSAPIRKKK